MIRNRYSISLCFRSIITAAGKTVFADVMMRRKNMRKNFGAKPYTYPQPVFIIATYGQDGTPDAMNAAWGGISGETEISMCLSAGHKTVKNILARRAFTVSMADAAHVTACDYAVSYTHLTLPTIRLV